MSFEIDVRAVLPSIRVPALVLHRTGDRYARVEEGRYLASCIPDATYVELPGEDHLPFVGDQAAIIEHLRTFVESTSTKKQVNNTSATVLAVSFKSVRKCVDSSVSPWRRFQDHITRELEWFGGCELKERDECLLASFSEPDRAVQCASAIAFYAARLGVQFAAGIHTDERQMTGTSDRIEAVETALRIEERAGLGEILVSAPVRDLLAGAGVRFQQKSLMLSGSCSIELLRFVNRGATARTAVA
jgi:hypothetical protein